MTLISGILIGLSYWIPNKSRLIVVSLNVLLIRNITRIIDLENSHEYLDSASFNLVILAQSLLFYLFWIILCFTISPNFLNVLWLFALLVYSAVCYYIGGLKKNYSQDDRLLLNSMIAFTFMIGMTFLTMKNLSFDILAEIEKRIHVQNYLSIIIQNLE
jgi:hypothetical protein